MHRYTHTHHVTAEYVIHTHTLVYVHASLFHTHRTGWMEAFENIAKAVAHKHMMTKNKEAAAAFKIMSAAYDAHLALYAGVHGQGFGVAKTTQNNLAGKTLKWKAVDLDTFNAYQDALAKYPLLMQGYHTELLKIEATKAHRK
jgi:hypothetical protein